jgi:NAD(P)-dependent dehydrogenase (short-subunit alcohol dehydrogenase family)
MTVLDLFDLSGRLAIVTGGGGGLGRELARTLAELGADVVLCARRQERCAETADELRDLGVRAVALQCDVRERDQVDAVISRALDEFGRVDVLVNNAGTAWGAPAEEVPLEAWRNVLEVNVTGTFLFSQAVGRAMIARGGGKIVNIASVAGLVGAPPELMDALPYSVSKGAVVLFTRDLAVKWARHGIAVNALAPGWFPTDMSRGVLEDHGDALLERIPQRRFGASNDLAGAIAFLASPASDYVTGHTLVVDGGLTAGG